MERKRPHSKTPPHQAPGDDHVTAGTSASTSVDTAEPNAAQAPSSSFISSQLPLLSSTTGRRTAAVLSLPEYSTQLVDNHLLRAITQQRRSIEFVPDAHRPRMTLEERRHDFETELSHDMFHFVFVGSAPVAGYNLILKIDPAQTVLQNDGEMIIRASKPLIVDGVRGHWSGRINRHSLQGDMIFVPDEMAPPRNEVPPSTTVTPPKRRMTSPQPPPQALASDFLASETTDGTRRTSESSESTLTPAPETDESPGQS
uniref:Uncharacterized protein n=1 Tax=Romanomermis culicivorax TaxID=13658 RepID=A0A915IZH6_ROMCU